MLAVSVEKIISLYIQKYRFEHYENNQDKYHEKLVLQKKKGGLRAMWGFAVGDKPTGAKALGPKTTPSGQSPAPEPVRAGVPTPGHRGHPCRFEKPGWAL